MSTVQRAITLNRIEAQDISFIAPMRMETWLDVQFLKQSGAPQTDDYAAQLHLTPRSGGTNLVYYMPSTDIVNGRARAVIPAGDLIDLNGYRIRVYGTWDRQPWLLATGVLSMVEGEVAAPFEPDTIDNVPIELNRGADGDITVDLWQDVSKAAPFDLGSATVQAVIYSAPNGALLTAFTTTVIDENTVRLTLPAAEVDELPDQCWWRLSITGASGLATLAQGEVTVLGLMPPPPPSPSVIGARVTFVDMATPVVFPVWLALTADTVEGTMLSLTDGVLMQEEGGYATLQFQSSVDNGNGAWVIFGMSVDAGPVTELGRVQVNSDDPVMVFSQRDNVPLPAVGSTVAFHVSSTVDWVDFALMGTQVLMIVSQGSEATLAARAPVGAPMEHPSAERRSQGGLPFIPPMKETP